MKRTFLHITLLLLLLPFVLQAQPKREFRASWLTTVWAIDWPTSWGDVNKGRQQQEELKALVDSLEAARMNAVFFQVRGFCDAMYNSAYEPWSKYLTGTRGGEPTYDPLGVLVEYAHSKGIEVHAWMNPYRYSTSNETYGTLPTDYSNTHPEWLVNCGGYYILNPCLPEVKTRIAAVVADLVEHYDVDGVIFDDYFYQSGYQNSYDEAYYQATGGGMSRADWRRAQVNEMVRMVHDTIRAVRPYVHFGIGPAGIAGKANTSAPVYGVEPCPVGSDWQYNGIYSDPLAWFDQKTIDYMAPQCYWTIGSSNDYDVLTDWWCKMGSHFGRHMYPSEDLSGGKGKSSSMSEEIGKQMILDREHDRLGAPGSCWYSLKSGMQTNGFFRYIRNNVNQHPAVVPQMWWLKQQTPLFVSGMQFVALGSGKMALTWTAPAPNLRYAIYRIPTDTVGKPAVFYGSEFLQAVTFNTSYEVDLTTGGTYAVSVLDRYGNEYPARIYGNTSLGNATAATLSFPAEGGTPLLPTWFSWNRVPGADSYFVQFSKSADFSTLDYETETADTCFFTANVEWLTEGQTYYWRVVTRAANSYDAVSASRSFSATYFKMIYPADEERDCPQTLTAVCDSVPDATAAYTFEFSKSTTFNSQSIIYTATSAQPRTTVPDSILMASTFYYVRAKVVYTGVSAISGIHRFRTAAQVVPVPTVISPAEGDTIVGTEVEVCWQQQASSGFRVEMSTSTAFAGRQTKAAVVTLNEYCHTYTDVEPGTYYVRVKAVADGVYTDPSAVVQFEVVAPSALVNTGAEATVRKVLENGQLVIIRDGVRYSVVGTCILH